MDKNIKASNDLVIDHRIFGNGTVASDITYNHAGKNLSLICRTTTYDPVGQEEFKKYFFTKLKDYAADIDLYYPGHNLPLTLIDNIFGELFQNIFESTLYSFMKHNSEASRLAQRYASFSEKAKQLQAAFPLEKFPVTFYFEAELKPHVNTPGKPDYTLDIRIHNHTTLSPETLLKLQRNLRLETQTIILESAEDGNTEKGSGGIGLGMVRDIVQAHDGQIIIDHIPLPWSTEDHGSFSVFISFPVGPRHE